MRYLKIIFIAMIILTAIQQSNAQQKTDDKQKIDAIINKYIKSVKERDSAAFYDLFNDGTVTWCAAIKDRSQAKEIETKGIGKARNSYFASNYKDFFEALAKYKTTEDKFDNINIIEDGTVASVTMDYSFWADGKMTNWGSKFLTLIKRDGKWKITSVIYSLELAEYFEQPPLKERRKKYKDN